MFYPVIRSRPDWSTRTIISGCFFDAKKAAKFNSQGHEQSIVLVVLTYSPHILLKNIKFGEEVVFLSILHFFWQIGFRVYRVDETTEELSAPFFSYRRNDGSHKAVAKTPTWQDGRESNVCRKYFCLHTYTYYTYVYMYSLYVPIVIYLIFFSFFFFGFLR